MILSWMLYASAVTLLVTLAALVLEGVVRQRSLPVRGLWVGALLSSLAIPVGTGALSTVRKNSAPIADVSQVEPIPAIAGPAAWVEWTEPVTSVATAPANIDLDPWLLVLWGVASLASLLSVALSYRALNRRRVEWDQRNVDGRDVRVSPDTGPAVVGFLPGEIVLPEWLLGVNTRDRQIVLSHEEEHLRAWDPAVLLGALLIAIVMPWNLGLWWLNRRLRRAVEIDCDLRVLRRGVDPTAYTRLLVDVTERGTTHRFAVAALAESPTFLERRIRLMLTPRSRWWAGRAAAAATVAGGMMVAACQIDRPEQSPIPATGAIFDVAKDGSLTKQSDAATEAVDTTEGKEQVSIPTEVALSTGSATTPLESFTSVVRTAVEQFYPNLLAERIPGSAINLYFLVDARGEMVKTAIDTEERSGSCSTTLRSGLAASGGQGEAPIASGGCGQISAGKMGPNKIRVYWAALKSQPGMEGAELTGPYRFAEVTRRGRPSEQALEAAVQQHHPSVLREGLPFGETLWFITDRNSRIVHTGRGPAFGSSRTAELQLEERFPRLDIGAITMSSQVSAATGDRIDVLWATLKEPGSPPDPQDALGSADPARHIRVFTVKTTAPGGTVRIRLSGEAARDLENFRIDGRFTREGNELIATTPFLFIPVSPAPFEATFTSSEGEVRIDAAANDSQVRMTGQRVVLGRKRAGAPIDLLGAERVQRIPLPSPAPDSAVSPVRQGPVSNFFITLNSTGPGIRATCGEGCAWGSLSADYPAGAYRITEHGIEPAQAGQGIAGPGPTAQFAMVVNTTERGIAANCERGCRWTNLGATNPGGTYRVTEQGIHAGRGGEQ